LYAGSVKSVLPNDIGRQQFFEFQSFGKRPEQPDKYYEKLVKGKEKFDYIVSEYQKMYRNGEWWGLYQVWLDWKEERWLLPYLLSWWKKETGYDLPNWITKDYMGN
jgi:hypothetical protein